MSYTSPAAVISNLNESLSVLHGWCQENRLTITISNTKAMILVTNKLRHQALDYNL